MTERFESERLAMRPLSVDDSPALHEAYRDVPLMRWWSSAPHDTIEQTRTYLTPRAKSDDWRGWAITAQGDDRAIGTLAAGSIRPRVSEIGYLLVREQWGRGYAREAVTALVSMLFAEGQRRIVADTDPDNHASNALLTGIGFQREGLLRAEWETHIGVRDSVIWGLLREEWPFAD